VRLKKRAALMRVQFTLYLALVSCETDGQCHWHVLQQIELTPKCIQLLKTAFS
jgi:hypothetical protein